MYKIAIIGGGPAGFGCYLESRVAGWGPEDMVVIDPNHHPIEEYIRKATRIGQDGLRSESADQFEIFDTLSYALSDSISHPLKAPQNLFGAAFHRYHADIAHVLERGKVVARKIGWYESLLQDFVERVERRPGSFALFNREGKQIAEAQHLFLGIGNGISREPPWFKEGKRRVPGRVADAYEFPAMTDIRNQIEGCVIAVGGAGLTGITRARQAVRAGAAHVQWLLRREPDFRPLNTDRKYFTLAGQVQLRSIADPEERIHLIKDELRGTFPLGTWKPFIDKAVREGRMSLQLCQPKEVRAGQGTHPVDIVCDFLNPETHQVLGEGIVSVDYFIGCFGFAKEPDEVPPLGQIMRDYHVGSIEGFPLIDEHYRISELSQRDSYCFLGGAYAQYISVAANTFRGGRQAGRSGATWAVHGGSRSPLTLESDSLRAWRLALGGTSHEAPPVPHIEELGPSGEPERFLPLTTPVSIGRGEGNVVCLTDDTAVSRSHAVVELKAGQPVVRDLGSANGTLVYRDGRWYRVNGESRLRTGDLLAVGTTQFRFAVGA